MTARHLTLIKRFYWTVWLRSIAKIQKYRGEVLGRNPWILWIKKVMQKSKGDPKGDSQMTHQHRDFKINRFCFRGHFKNDPEWSVKSGFSRGISWYSGSSFGTPNSKNQGGSKQILKIREPAQNPKLNGVSFGKRIWSGCDLSWLLVYVSAVT